MYKKKSLIREKFDNEHENARQTVYDKNSEA
jgi:hypothetical protein